MKIKKVLIANRGEIAVRIEKTAKRMGITTVAIYSNKDRNALHVCNCDEAYLLEGDSLADTYLNITKIIEIAIKTNCNAIHPGYGFLSENPAFAKACTDHNILFIGPDSDAISLMGNKLQARQLVNKIGVPITKGVSGTVQEILAQKEKLSFPVLVKAASGGGGKGMRIVSVIEDLEDALISTSREAENYFGDGTVYLEKYIESPRHIEVQILADHHDNVIHLAERECSLQRRYQKIIEEAPSITLNEKKRKEITNAAIQIATEINYSNAGTIEFLVDENLDFYFLEMNTRIQVEHPVTEMVTGIDIVEQQFKIASGEHLTITQSDIHINGHAIEARIYAEDPMNKFIPSAGKMTLYLEPQSENIRIDSAYHDTSEVFSDFDPMISKLISHGKNRNEAIDQLKQALENYQIHGIETNTHYLQNLISNVNYLENNISTSFIESNTQKLLQYKNQNKKLTLKILSSALLISLKPQQNSESIWEEIGYWRLYPKIEFTLEDQDFEVKFSRVDNKLKLSIENTELIVDQIHYKSNQLTYLMDNEYVKCYFSLRQPNLYINHDGWQFKVLRSDILDSSAKWENKTNSLNNEKALYSPLPGKVVKVEVEEGQKVTKNQALIIVEAMKMENKLVSKFDTTISKINVKVGQQVDSELALIEFQNDKAKAQKDN